MVIGAGLFVAVSGLMMLIGVFEGQVKFAHEWVGLVFAAGIALHVLTHWQTMKSYFSQRKALGVMSGALVLTVGLMTFSAMGSNQNPMRAAVGKVETAPLTVVADLQNVEPEVLRSRLQAAGFAVEAVSLSIQDIARNNNTESHAVFEAAFKAP